MTSVPAGVTGRPSEAGLFLTVMSAEELTRQSAAAASAAKATSVRERAEGLRACAGRLFIRLAPQAARYLRVALDDARGRRRVRVHRPVLGLERAAEDDPVRAREHVERVGEVAVVNLGLRQQHLYLAAHRGHPLVAEECARAEARAVEDDALGQCRHLLTRLQLPHDELAARR